MLAFSLFPSFFLKPKERNVIAFTWFLKEHAKRDLDLSLLNSNDKQSEREWISKKMSYITLAV